MNPRLAILALLCCAPLSWAQIVRTGSCSAAATSCSLSAVNTGDLVVCQGYRSGSTTAPGTPTSNTSVLTLATSTGGTTGAERVWCRKASSSSDTGSGTSSNASTVACLAYSGTAVGTTANCNTTGLGGTASNQAKASTTIDYPALTMAHPDGSSWVAELAGDSAAAPGCPSDASSVTTAGTAPATRACDTGAGVAGHSDRTVTVASSTWLSAVLEILATTVATPSYDNDAGTYNGSVNVTISDATGGASIVYCTDTTNACTPTTAYTAPVTISTTGTYLRSQATKTGMTPSAVKSAGYTICSGNCPGLVQHFDSPSTDASPGVNGCSAQLPNPSGSGNLVISTLDWDVTAGVTASVTDDQSQSYQVITKAGSSGYHSMAMAYVVGSVAGVKKITWSFSGGTPQYVSCSAAEFYNIATSAADVTSASTENVSGSTTWQATGTLAGNASASVPYLVYQCATANGSGQALPVTAGTGYTLAAVQPYYGCQWKVAAAAETNPAFTMVNSVGYITIAAAFKGAAAGTAPSAGIRVVRVQHNHVYGGTSSFTIQFSTSGNLKVMSGNGGQYPTSVSSSPSCTWQQTPDSPEATSKISLWYASNCTAANTGTLSVTLNAAADVGGDYILWDVAGADASAYDTHAAATGSQTVAGNLTTVSITPSQANELVIAVGDQYWTTMTGLVADANGHTPIFDEPTWPAQAEQPGGGGAGGNFTLDAQAAHVYSPDTTAVTFVWTVAPSMAAGDWYTLAAAFKAAPGGGVRKRVLSIRR